MASSPGSHTLAMTDLAALATNDYPIGILHRLRAAEIAKHAFLIEALRRAMSRDERDSNAIGPAVAVLAEVQATAPDVVDDVLALPQVGFWAADCLSRPHGDPPGPEDLAQLAGFAALAALRAGHPFDLAVPVRHGTVLLPALGLVQVETDEEERWARVRMDRDQTAAVTVTAGASIVEIHAGSADGSWTPVPRLHAHAGGLHLDVLLDAFDPFLGRLAPAADGRRLDLSAWQRLLPEAWQILVRYDRPAARRLAAVLTTLVPLRERGPDQPSSASSGWAWGAIGLSLPADAPSLAETLVHEFQHIVLSAVEDLVPLIDGDDGRLYYSPWRDDPRPLRGLLQGAYAFLGVSEFWYRLRRIEPSARRLRSQVEFARRRQNTLEATRTLAGSPALTEPGRAFVAGIAARLTEWPGTTVSAEATATATEITLEHRLRWRLSHLRPDPVAVDTLARAWIAGALRRPVVPPPPSALVPAAHPLPDDLSSLLELRYRDRRRLWERLAAADNTAPRKDNPTSGESPPGDLLRGHEARALRGYLARVTAADSLSAWVGLILAWRQLADQPLGSLMLEQPELFAAVFARVRALTGTIADVQALITWLNEGDGEGEGHGRPTEGP
jgi:HEXXH motif-containing protein